MAVIKYRASDGSIKTVPLIGQSGVTSINGKSGAVTGIYGIDNPPPYPVTSVNNMTGNININNYNVHRFGTEESFIVTHRTMHTFYIHSITNFVVSSGSQNYLNIASWNADYIIGIGASLRSSSYGYCGISLISYNNGANILFNNQSSNNVQPVDFFATFYNYTNENITIILK